MSFATTRAGRLANARGALIVTQMGIAVVVVASAALVSTSLKRLMETEIGARSDGITTLRLELPRTRYDAERVQVFFEQLRSRLTTVPGVTSVASANSLPVSGQREMTVAAAAPAEPATGIGVHMISPGYFDLLEIDLVEGRFMTAAEHALGSAVAVINRAAAAEFFPGSDAVGNRLSVALGVADDLLVIGVVDDVRYGSVEEPAGPDVYIPETLYPVESRYLLLGTPAGAVPDAEAMLAQVRALDANLPIYDLRSMADRVAAAVSRTRFAATLLVAFAGIALLLAAIGVYGVVATAVGARRREIGIRMALGARTHGVLGGILVDALGLAGAALLIGIPAAIAGGSLLGSLLYAVAANDVRTLAAVAAVITLTALVASLAPARQAARTDPMTVLRHE
jgi:predicted permease